MYCIYVLHSGKDNSFYVGYTADLGCRIKLHDKGSVPSTRDRRPLRLVYYEACTNQEDALHRERYLKTTYGKRYIKTRLKGCLADYHEEAQTF